MGGYPEESVKGKVVGSLVVIEKESLKFKSRLL